MEKSRKRGERRWRGFRKWMRRLKRDWNDHGWGRGLDGRFTCDCFYLNHPQALRFKDTPKGCSSGPGCGNPRKWSDGKSSEALTVAEKVVQIQDREAWSKRKRRDGTHPYRVLCCRCGRLISIVQVPNGPGKYWATRDLRRKVCDPCKD